MALPCTEFLCWTLALSSLVLNIQRDENELVSRNDWDNVYDYIIVGGGTAGSVVASRLTEDPNVRVLVLEAGGAQLVESSLPWFEVDSPLDWGFFSVPQKYVGGAFPDRRVRVRSSSVIGGTSAINWNVYNRGNPLDYDSWAKNYGLTEWSYEKVLPFFVRSEHNTDQKIVNQNPDLHGVGGPLNVESEPNPSRAMLDLLDVFNQNGYPTVDINSRKTIGATIAQKTQRDHIKQSTARAFLQPVIDRKNLHIVGGAFVTRVLIEGRRAVGVEFFKKKSYHKVEAKKEVIVSAGAMMSPKVLMLSGIGPSDHLAQHGIQTVVDLPVGSNFHNHVGITYQSPFLFDLIDQTLADKSPPAPSLNSTYNFFFNRIGSLASPAYLRVNFATHFSEDPTWPDAAFVLAETIDTNLTQSVELFHDQKAWTNFLRPTFQRWRYHLAVEIIRPKSRGTIRLASSDPFAPPLIDPNYLDKEDDYRRLVDAIRTGLQVMQSQPMLPLARIYSQPMPGCEHAQCSVAPDVTNYFGCDSYLQCVIDQLGQGPCHFGGSCRMGRSDDPRAVVDQQLRVLGVDGLRVADSSVIPDLPSGNTNAPTIMIGERAADFIKNSY